MFLTFNLCKLQLEATTASYEWQGESVIITNANNVLYQTVVLWLMKSNPTQELIATTTTWSRVDSNPIRLIIYSTINKMDDKESGCI